MIKANHQEVVTAMIFNVGMCNTSFGSVLAIAYFPPAVAFPIILTLLYQHPIAAIVTKLFAGSNQKGGAFDAR